MSSPSQIQANQANAQLSCGPTTPTGKATSAQNSRKHGLTASSVNALKPEWRSEFAEFQAQLFLELSPNTLSEEISALEYAFNQFLYTKAAAHEIDTLEALGRNPHDPATQLAHDRAVRYGQSLRRRARTARKDLENAQLNRQLAAQIEEVALTEHQKEIHIPPGVPLHRILNQRNCRIKPADLALRFALAVEQAEREVRAQQQNEPNPEDEFEDLHL